MSDRPREGCRNFFVIEFTGDTKESPECEHVKDITSLAYVDATIKNSGHGQTEGNKWSSVTWTG